MKIEFNSSRLVIITAIIIAVLTFGFIDFFLKGDFLEDYKKIYPSGFVNAIGLLIIIIVMTVLSLIVMLLYKKYKLKK